MTQPTIDQERVAKIYTSLSLMDVSLDADPLAYGPKRLNTKVYEVRALLSRLERTYLSVAQDLQWFKHKLRKVQAIIDLTKHELFASDPEVRAGRNVADREALAAVKIQDEIKGKIEIEDAVHELEGVMTVVKAKRTDLKDIQGRLRDQIKLCQEEIALGGHWGSRPPPGTNVALEPGQNPLEQLDSFLDDVEGEFHVKAAPEVEEVVEEELTTEKTAEEALPSGSTGQSEIDSFLQDLEPAAPMNGKSKASQFADETVDLDGLIESFK